ncbi:hypothetical protein CR513_23469, partial [Mucuna pruriens]
MFPNVISTYHPKSMIHSLDLHSFEYVVANSSNVEKLKHLTRDELTGDNCCVPSHPNPRSRHFSTALSGACETHSRCFYVSLSPLFFDSTKLNNVVSMMNINSLDGMTRESVICDNNQKHLEFNNHVNKKIEEFERLQYIFDKYHANGCKTKSVIDAMENETEKNQTNFGKVVAKLLDWSKPKPFMGDLVDKVKMLGLTKEKKID